MHPIALWCSLISDPIFPSREGTLCTLFACSDTVSLVPSSLTSASGIQVTPNKETEGLDFVIRFTENLRPNQFLAEKGRAKLTLNFGVMIMYSESDDKRTFCTELQLPGFRG